MPFPVADAFIQDAETKLGLRLPEGYRTRVLHQNGGEVLIDDEDWQLYPVKDTTDRKRLARTCNDIVRETLVARLKSGFPPAAVAIASNGAGDELVLLPSATVPGMLDPALHRWDHETRLLIKITDDLAAVLQTQA